MNAEWLWLAGIVGGIGAFMLTVELLARFAPPGEAGSGRDDEEEDEGSSFTVDE